MHTHNAHVLPSQGFQQLFVVVVYFHFKGHLTYCEVGGACKAWVVGSESHLHHIQYSLTHFSAVYNAFGCVSY